MKATLTACVSQMEVAGQRFVWTDAGAYMGWLAQTYYYVRHSTRLLASAAARFPQSQQGNALHLRFGAHIGEEKRHELLCLRDIHALGGSLDAYPEQPTTRMFYEPQYYKVEHQAPSALLGYILPLEVIAPQVGAQIIEQVSVALGAKCTSFLKVHAAEDVSHVQKALALLDALPENERDLIRENMQQTALGYVHMLRAITEHAASLPR